MEYFIQEAPKLKNQYEDDILLKSYLKKEIPSEILAEIEPNLRNLGERVITDILEMGHDAEAHEPELINFDAWGNRIDEIRVARGWKELDKVSAEEGLVSIGFKRKYNEYSRIYQFAKIYLFTPSSAIYTCPLAMTDGAARLIEVYGDDELKNEPYKHLTSRDPAEFWTSGQWMTERTGGSDVGTAETVARLENGEYRLYGLKWFASAATSQIAMTLARIEDENGNVVEGSRGLSLFYVKLRDENGKLNNIIIHRLKDKLGTRALPTAELELVGTPAKLVGGPGKGVKKIATLFNITRIYNAVTSVSFMRRVIALARDYSFKRVAFKKKLSEHPLHLEALADMEVEYQGAFHLAFYVVKLLGKEECNVATEDEKAVLRILTPIAKLYTAKQAINVVSEAIEAIGGAGYLEDTDIAKYLRDVQVLSIWEGTTNVLSLDVWRAIKKENAFNPLMNDIKARLQKIKHPELQPLVETVQKAVKRVETFFSQCLKEGQEFIEASARSFAYSLARITIASLILEHAEWALKNEPENIHKIYSVAAKRWCQKDLTPLIFPNSAHQKESKLLALYQ